MRTSPRKRRLAADYEAVCQLQTESSLFAFEAQGPRPESYRLFFRGYGFWKMDDGQIVVRDDHQVVIELGSAYPRLIPNLIWQTPIFHPNISSGGVVCLGGYGTSWVPSLTLSEMCIMLWDMIRYRNYDVESPYNREAAEWAKTQEQFQFPIDQRSLRNEVSGEAQHVPDAMVRNVVPPPVIQAPSGRSFNDRKEASPVRQNERPIIEIVSQEIGSGDSDGITFID